jgi:hypothetical protein
MITCDIGPNGRLGNQMFQYAALLGIATKQGLEYGIDYNLGDSLSWRENAIEPVSQKLTIDKCFDLSAKQSTSPSKTIHEDKNEYHFQEKFFHTGDDVKLRGYFQTNKYFDHIEDQIRSEFKFKQDIVDEASNFLSSKRDNEVVSVHVRRGDYLQYTWHGVCSNQYYGNALSSHFTDKSYNFVVLTDDIPWAKTTFSGSENIFISETQNQYVDLCIMTMCDHHILSNSSFSWWGSWLNPSKNKKIVAPSTWFRDQLKSLDTKDLYQPNWIII